MIDRGKHGVLGVQINAVDYTAAVERIIQAAHEQRTMAISALAVHGLMTGVHDPEYLYRLNHFDLIVPDGQPVRWALNSLYGTNLPDRVYGPTLTLKVCERAAMEGLPIYLFGSKIEVLDSLENNLTKIYPKLQIAGKQPSKFRQVTENEVQESIDDIQSSGARVVFVGLGCPRQEIWVYEHLGRIPMPMLAVGAAFDFHAGSLAQAPAYLQRWGLEWAYRLMREPRRLWKRYAILNPQFLYLLGLQTLGIRSFSTDTSEPPNTKLNYG